MADAPLGIHCQDCVTNEPSELVMRYYLQALSRDLLPGEKVGECMRTIAPFKSTVEIATRIGAKRAHYRNLVVCSRIWQCPVCASTISDDRRRELTTAIAHSGLYPVLITYTLRHNQKHALKGLVSDLLQAFRSLKSGKSWQNFTNEYFWEGSVRALEVTHGVNGWHPHLHELALLSVPLTGAIEQGITSYVKSQWRKVVDRVGQNATWEHGADVRTEDHEIREYVAKFGRLPKNVTWTVEHELTKAVVKRSRHDGRTPMQLLLDYGTGDKRAGALFVEYSRAFKGRNQLVWSRGLREKLGLGGELSDEQVAENAAENGRVLATLTREQWRIIVSLKQRAQVLEYASRVDEGELSDYLNDLFASVGQKQPA